MDAAYWNKLARTYEHRVLNAWGDARTPLLQRIVRKHAEPNARAADFGCGTGHGLRLLAQNFRHVDAYDYARENLAIARDRHSDFDNIAYHHRDLSNGEPVRPKVHFAVCVNVLIAPDSKLRDGILSAIACSLRPGGRLLLVVPSLESSIYVDHQLLEWNLREGVDPKDARRETLAANPKFDLANGIVPLDTVPTRHYLREELETTLPHHGLTPIRIQKLTYPWTVEFHNPPPFLTKPYSWDWAVTAEKQPR